MQFRKKDSLALKITGVFLFLSIKMIMKEFNISPDMIDIIALSSNFMVRKIKFN